MSGHSVEQRSSYSSFSASSNSHDDVQKKINKSIEQQHPRSSTATFGNTEEIKNDYVPEKFLQTERSGDDATINEGTPMKTTSVSKRGQMVNSKRQLTLMTNGDITYTSSKQGFNFFKQQDTYKNLIKLEDLVEVLPGKGNQLTFVKKNVIKGKAKHANYTFSFESSKEAYAWE